MLTYYLLTSNRLFKLFLRFSKKIGAGDLQAGDLQSSPALFVI